MINIRQSNRDTTLTLIPIVAIIGKVIQIFILPDKYFYDSNRMVSMLTGNGMMAGWSGYQTTVDIFRKIDIFHFTTHLQWSIALGIIGTVLLMVLCSKCKELSMSESVYILMATGLLNIYVFNIAKEPIQLFFFLCIAIIINLPIENTFLKIIGCALIYYWESNTFRTYYIIMACMCIVLYFIFYLLRKTKKKITKTKITIAIAACFVAMFVFVYASQYIDAKSYYQALNIRDSNGNLYANTSITNIYEVNDNYGMFMFNYVIAAVRMLIPIELPLKSPVYFPFFIYQIFILSYWIRALKNIKILNDRVLLSLICFTAYLFGSFVFEPDFGSWVRHEAASFPIFYFMAIEDLGKKDVTINCEKDAKVTIW